MLAKCKQCQRMFRVPGGKSLSAPGDQPKADTKPPAGSILSSSQGPRPASRPPKPPSTFARARPNAGRRAIPDRNARGGRHTAAGRPSKPQRSLRETESGPVDGLELIEEEEEKPIRAPRRPTPEAVTRSPGPRPKTPVSDVEEAPELEEVAADPEVPESRKPGPKKKRKRRSEPKAGAGFWLALAGVGLLWIVMTPLSYLWLPVAYFVLMSGVVVAFIGRRWLSRIARDEGGIELLLMWFVPFYRFYFCFTRLSQTMIPFAIWVCGMAFLTSGSFCVGLHNINGSPGFFQGMETVKVTKRARPKQRTPEEIDEECDRLLAGRRMASVAGRSGAWTFRSHQRLHCKRLPKWRERGHRVRQWDRDRRRRSGGDHVAPHPPHTPAILLLVSRDRTEGRGRRTEIPPLLAVATVRYGTAFRTALSAKRTTSPATRPIPGRCPIGRRNGAS